MGYEKDAVVAIIFTVFVTRQLNICSSIEPSVITVKQGENTILPCNILAVEPKLNINGNKYQWKLNGSDIESSSRRRYLDNGNLLIRHIDVFHDTGEYLCLLEDNNKRVIYSKPINLKVNWIRKNISVIPYNFKSSSELEFVSNLTLKCDAEGSQNVKIDWTRNGERISNNEKFPIEDAYLRIKAATSGINGAYRCIASNQAGVSVSRNNFALTIKSEKCANIQRISPDSIYKIGDKVVIDCIYDNADLLEWYFEENGPLRNSSSFTLLNNNSLVIKNFQPQYQGMYACVGVKKECDPYPTKYTVVVSVADLDESNSSLLDPSNPMEHIVAEGNDFSMTCNPPKGNPSPTIIWKNQYGQPLKSTGRIRTNGYDLIITNAKKIDSGAYMCTAQNAAGVKESWFNLTVAVLPLIIDHPQSKTVAEGNNATLRCTYEGTAYPFTRILWYKNGTLFLADSDETVISNRTYSSSLNLVNVDLTDAASYFCMVNTTFFPPQISRNATLVVIQKLKFNPLPAPKKMELGTSVKIPCKAEGTDQPTVTWIKENFFKNNSNIQTLPSNIHNLNGTLYFPKVHKQDKGRYTCIASNSQGTINITVDVDVVVTPKFVILPKNPSEGYEGRSIILDCIAEGDPLPTIQWDSNLIDISQKRFHTLSNGSLLITELRVSDSGIYGCTAGNSGGFNRTETYLNVKGWDPSKTDGSTDDIEGDTVGRTIVITLGAASAYILLVIVLMAWCRYRRKRKKQAYLETNGDVLALDDEETKLHSKASAGDSTIATTTAINATVVSHVNNGNSSGSSESAYLTDECLDQLPTFSRENLHDIMLLGQGEFGRVYLARNKCANDTVVMVKVLEETKSEFHRQLNIVSRVEQEGIVRLIGICKEADPVYMILEYTDWGDLKQFLIATRKSSVRVMGNKQRPSPLTLLQSFSIIQQTCSALQHLTQQGFTHRHIAARNCLISSSLNVKLTFATLCKDTYANEYYEIRNQLLPLRWLPLEAIVDDDFSITTDIYSFACLIWEIFAKGELPFSKLSNEEVLNLLEKRELRWKVPKSMPPMLAKLLFQCWSYSPPERPTFAQISNNLDEIINNFQRTSS